MDENNAERYMQSKTKRTVDLLGAVVTGSTLAAPSAIGAFWLYLVENQAPIFKNERYGANFKTFDMLKLTTMQSDAHLHEKSWQFDETDDRITATGSILRKLDLNETPQILNVLKRDMHFVGARAVNEHSLNRMQESDPRIFDEWHDLYSRFCPGIVGPGQLAERRWVRRGDLKRASQERMKEDMRYWTESASVSTDIRTMLSVPQEWLQSTLTSKERISSI